MREQLGSPGTFAISSGVPARLNAGTSTSHWVADNSEQYYPGLQQRIWLNLNFELV